MNLFSKLFSSNKKKSEKDAEESFAQSKYMPHEELPVDEQFMLNFREKGGKFLYCDSLTEALESFDNILLENNWYETDVCCFEPQLENDFTTFNLKSTLGVGQYNVPCSPL